MRSYELRSMLEAKEHHVVSINMFRQKYAELPGDFSKATRLWGTHSLCGGTGAGQYSTCNGDGSGHLNSLAIMNSQESSLFWNHLGNSGLIEKKYVITGGTIPDPFGYPFRYSYFFTPNENLASFFDGSAGWLPLALSLAGDTNPYGFFPGAYGNFLMLASISTSDISVLTPTEMLVMDEKIDDGKPATGKIVVPHGTEATLLATNNPYCTLKADGTQPTDIDDIDATYAAAGQYGNQLACSPIFKDVF